MILYETIFGVFNIEGFIQSMGFNATIATIRRRDGNKIANWVTKQLAQENEGL